MSLGRVGKEPSLSRVGTGSEPGTMCAMMLLLLKMSNVSTVIPISNLLS